MKISGIITMIIVAIVIFKFYTGYSKSSEGQSSGESKERWNTKMFKTDDMEKLKANVNAAVHRQTAPDTVVTDFKMIENALHMYSLNGGKIPTDEEGLNVLVENQILQERHTIDPWGTPYAYERELKSDTSMGKMYQIFLTCAGPDKAYDTADDLTNY